MSERRRFDPPPMRPSTAEPGDGASPTPLTLDERVVRKMLRVNPGLRAGRTTLQVKRALEGGQAITTANAAPVAAPSQGPVAPHDASRSELDAALSFFLRGKSEALQTRLAELQAERAALEAQERAVRDTTAADIARFVGLLDEAVVARHGTAILAGHTALLAQLNLSAAQLLAAAQRSRSPR